MKHFNKKIKDANHQLSECMEDIDQAGDTYEEIVLHQFNLYDTSPFK